MIRRDLFKATQDKYDLIIIGGGIYGIALLHRAAGLNLRSLLVEQDDFAHATSTNSLRIIHGGFRYLQNLDLHRFYESVGERRWFLKTFGGLARPLACLMPLYNRGMLRSWIMGPGLMVNDLLSWHRNRHVGDANRLPNGRIVNSGVVQNLFKNVQKRGLVGGALWYDGTIDTPQRALMEWLKAAVDAGGEALNYVRATELLYENQQVQGVRVVDRMDDRAYDLKANLVVNASGPWCRDLAARFDRDEETLFRKSIAWNLLFDRLPLSDHALAITPPVPRASTYFLRPWKGRLLAGTVHEPYNGPICSRPVPEMASVKNYIDKLNLAIPGLNLRESQIMHVFSGLLPAKTEGSERLAVREVIHDHAQQGGPKGLFTVSGVKFTTARLVAEKTLKILCAAHRAWQCPENTAGLFDFRVDAQIGDIVPGWQNSQKRSGVLAEMQEIIRTESVLHLDDLVLRRTTLGDDPGLALATADLVCDCFDWDPSRRALEKERLENAFPWVQKNKTGTVN